MEDYNKHNGKKVVYVVRVNNYLPDLCEYTIPNLKCYAKKIGADFIEIMDRKYPEFPPTYEKLQVYDLGYNNEWNILVDADFLLHPLTPDFTKILKPEQVGFDYGYKASVFLDTSSKYFVRDGRDRGIATGLVVTHHINHDLWTPLEGSWDEVKVYTKREHIIDEYCLSRNLAKFGLKYFGLLQNFKEIREKCLIHLGTEGKSEGERAFIVDRAKNLVSEWGQI